MELRSENIAMWLKQGSLLWLIHQYHKVTGMKLFKLPFFLINRLPSPNTQNKSPFQILFHRLPDYTLLKTFGCLCYPYLKPYNKHKLQYRLAKCVFLGYSASHHGYHRLNLQIGHIIISRLVTFDEYISPFSTPTIPMPFPTSPNQQKLSDPPLQPTSIFTPPHQPTA